MGQKFGIAAGWGQQLLLCELMIMHGVGLGCWQARMSGIFCSLSSGGILTHCCSCSLSNNPQLLMHKLLSFPVCMQGMTRRRRHQVRDLAMQDIHVTIQSAYNNLCNTNRRLQPKTAA
jgi:hypothetical protein